MKKLNPNSPHKPLIIGERPWWRHPVFPWGWYSISKDSSRILPYTHISPSGYYHPNDGGGTTLIWDAEPASFEWDAGCESPDISHQGHGVVVKPTAQTGSGRWIRQREPK